jgi:hypothetical protein
MVTEIIWLQSKEDQRRTNNGGNKTTANIAFTLAEA